MRLGIDTYSFQAELAAGKYNLFSTLEWMQAQQLCGLQININGPNGRFLGADPSDLDHRKRVRRAIEAVGFFVEVGGGQIIRETEVIRQLQLASDLGADVLRTIMSFETSLEHTLGLARKSLEVCLPIAESLGVRIALENHEDITGSELAGFLQEINHPSLGALLDTGNEFSVYQDPLEAARLLAPYAISTHIKDQKRVLVGDEVCSVGVALGTGDVPLPAIIKLLNQESALDRILLQNTVGYGTPMNRFNRSDLEPAFVSPDIPKYVDRSALEKQGYFFTLETLPESVLNQLADSQMMRLSQDIRYIRNLF